MKKNIMSALLFIALVCATFWVLFRDNSIWQVVKILKEMNELWVLAGFVAAILFVCMEGFMIWYLLRIRKSHIGLLSCVRYSFIGFFFSGITPSATGGQPVQLYYMKKDKISLADGTAVLMTVAVLYKMILVLMGLGIGVIWRKPLAGYLGNYLYLYWLGMAINIVVIAVLLFVMVSPNVFSRIVLWIEKALIRVRLLKKSEKREESLHKMVADFSETIQFFLNNKGHIIFVAIVTFVQRTMLFLPTYFVYRGMGAAQESTITILLLQASVYIAVDMLPLPGAQGITELMYRHVFATIFVGNSLLASTLATRGINFYFLLLVSGVIALVCYCINRKKCKKASFM